MRCGMMTTRLDSSADIMTGIDANPFWTGLRVSGDLQLNTSQLCQCCQCPLAGPGLSLRPDFNLKFPSACHWQWSHCHGPGASFMFDFFRAAQHHQRKE